jgi:DNA-binding NarL/FixJ family response regulator
MKRLLLMADHPLIVQAIRLALRQTAGFQVVGYVDGRRSACSVLAELRPDVVVVDDMTNPEDALARLRETAERVPTAECLLLTARMDPEWVDSAFAAGASAVVAKTVHPVALGTLLREIVAGNVVHRPRRPAAQPSTLPRPLTARELEILRLAAQGMTNGQIARELWVTEPTVKFHLTNTYRKLGVANRTEASWYAQVNDLVAPDDQLAS